ncbi:MAG: carboxyl transferase domain-containing protein [Myxococcota bacterium]
MAQIPLRPVGAAREHVTDDATFGKERDKLHALERRVLDGRQKVHAGWGEKYVARVHDDRKLTARERLARIADEGSEVFEVGTFVNEGEKFGKLESPGAGVITAFVRIEGRWCIVIANDNTVASGAWWPQTPEKIQRAQTMALRLRLPAIYLVDCSGLFLPEQSRSFSGGRGAGHIFKMNSKLSAEGVPQLAGVFGDCIAGGGYMPIISDRVYMTEQAYMVIAGAALIKGAKSQQISSLDIGGPEVHAHLSGCADERVPDDETLLRCLRAEVAQLPSSAADYYRGSAFGGSRGAPPTFSPLELAGLLPTDHREAYDALQVIARLCDHTLFWEVMEDRGREMICGVGRVGGLWAGFVMNRQGLIDSNGQQRPGGSLYREGIAKVAAFSRACNTDGLPILWLQDISGFDIGAEAEAQGLLGYGSSLIHTNSNNQTPMFTVLLRKASGAGYYAMAGLPYDPVVQLSTSLSRLSVMEGRTLAIATFNTKLDDNFEIVTQDPDERAALAEKMKAVEARIEQDMDPFEAARRMNTDEIVRLEELRPWLETLVECAYQSTGYRTVRNPRIWSLHDVALLAERNDATESVEAGAESAEGVTTLLSPMTGRLALRVKKGDRVGRGQRVAVLRVLGRAYFVTAPSAGQVREVVIGHAEYGKAFLVLEAAVDDARHDDATSELTGNIFASPMSGRFYLRPSPDDDAFVKAGDRVGAGDAVGLLEIMKTFNRVRFEGASATIKRVLVEDGADVDEGQALFELE